MHSAQALKSFTPAIIDAAFNQIRQYSSSSAAVMIRMLQTIALVAGFAAAWRK